MEKHILNIGQISITVENIERATSFYKEKLGLNHLFTAGNLVFFKCGETRIMLSENEESKNSIFYFNVSNIHQTYENFKKLNIEFIQPPHLVAKVGKTETWMGFFKDSEGNTLAIMNEFEVE